MSKQKKPKFKNTVFILDTCILQYIDNNVLTKEVTDLISELKADTTNQLTISNYTVLEALDSTKADSENRIVKTIELFTRYDVTTEVLRGAAQMSAIYAEDANKEEEGKIKIPSSGDRIIAATSILVGGVVITSNGRDFPRPFFSEVYKLDSEHKGRKLSIFFLKPNTELINNRFLNRKR